MSIIARITALGLIIATCNASQAAMISSADHSTFGTDSLTYDSVQGLYFLDLVHTLDETYDYVFSELGTGGEYEGFRFATEQEVINLVNNWGFSPTAMAGVETVGNTGGDQISGLVDLVTPTRIVIPSFRESNGVTGTSTGSGVHRIVSLGDVTPPLSNDDVDADGVIADNSSLATLGSWLVLLPETSSVPEPSGLALLGISTLIGTCCIRRKR